MPVCNVYGGQICQNAHPQEMNIYMEARLMAGFKSRKDACEVLPIGDTTLTRIESSKRKPTDEEVCIMADKYEQDRLIYFYCQEQCTISQRIREKSEEKDLCGSTLGFMNSFRDTEKCISRMSEIADDNQITDDEIEDLKVIVNRLITLESRIHTYLRRANEKLRIAKILQQRRQKQKPLASVAAERRANYNF